MKLYNYFVGIPLIAASLTSCDATNGRADGYGNFEATEVTISAEHNGKLLQFDVNEGDLLPNGKHIGTIDTIALHLKREQLKISKIVVGSKSKGVLSQINVLQAKLKTVNTNRIRIENLIKDNAGTQKQLDDITGEIEVIQQQIRSVEIQNAPVVNEIRSLDVQIQQIEDQISKCKITNPINGTVLSKYAEPYEITAFGKPLYKIADIRVLELRVYISEIQLTNVKIGQEVMVKIDDSDGMKSFIGKVNWIASEAEFTPKIIQTKEERVALVYAVKIAVENDGSLKIGMPAEMWLKTE